MHSLSVIEPISAALLRTRRVLFEPFLLSKWLQLGLCAVLMGSLQPVSFGGGGSNTGDSGFSSGVGTNRFEGAIAWIQDHLLPFLAGVVRNRGAIKAPWHEFRREANSLFRFPLPSGSSASSLCS